MSSSIRLLINPIKGLVPKYTEEDYNKFLACVDKNYDFCDNHKNLIISMANLLYKIELDDVDKKLLWKAIRNNKSFLNSFGVKKKEVEMELFDVVAEALDYRYKY